MAAVFDEAQLKLAINELKATTRVTMETVGVRFGRRVNTSVYREHLLRVPGNPAPACDADCSFVPVLDYHAEAGPARLWSHCIGARCVLLSCAMRSCCGGIRSAHAHSHFF